jgi:hypothetical protein
MGIGMISTFAFLKNEVSPENSKKKSIRDELKQFSQLLTKDSIFSIVTFMISTFIYSMASEIFGIWALLPLNEGGLNFDPQLIGIVQSINSLFFLLGQIFLYNLIVNCLGKLNSFRVGFVFFSFLVLTPLLNLVTVNIYLFWSLLVLWCFVRTIGMILSATTTNIFLLNAVPSNIQGLMMGISQSGSCISRTIGQLAAGNILALSKKISFPIFLMDVFVPHAMIGIFCILDVLLTIPISNSINSPKETF